MNKYLTLVLVALLLLSGCAREPVSTPAPSSPVPPVADFEARPTKGAIPLTVTFTASTTGDITQWHWDFGDGQFSNKPEPNHIYTKAGKYSVSLTIMGPGGSDMETKVDYIEVVPVAISWEEADKYVGQHKIVEGIIVGTKYAPTSRGQPTFLNIGKPYPEPGRFTVLIWGSDRQKFVTKFPPNPETYFLEKRVQVSGLIEEYPKGSGNPEIILSDPSQIRPIEK